MKFRIFVPFDVDDADNFYNRQGLVRYGVAPDHPEVKNVITEFEQILDRPNCRFMGNISVGEHVSLQELRDMYHAVVLAYGASEDRVLGIKGESLEGCLSARSFVAWCATIRHQLSHSTRADS